MQVTYLLPPVVSNGEVYSPVLGLWRWLQGLEALQSGDAAAAGIVQQLVADTKERVAKLGLDPTTSGVCMCARAAVRSGYQVELHCTEGGQGLQRSSLYCSY